MCPTFNLASAGLWIVACLFFVLHLISTYKWVNTIFVFLGLVYLTQDVIFSSSSHLPANCKMSLFFTPLGKCTTFYLFILCFGGHQGCFHFLYFTNSDAIKMAELMPLWCYCVCFGYMPRIDNVRSCGRFIPNFLRNLHTVFQSGSLLVYSYQQWKKCSLFSSSAPV